MFSWVEYEILGLARTEYLVLSTILVAGVIFLVYLAFVTFKRFRFMDATATSKIRSAAQGQVELKGLAEFMQNDTIYSPFSGSRCVWYHCSIDKKNTAVSAAPGPIFRTNSAVNCFGWKTIPVNVLSIRMTLT